MKKKYFYISDTKYTYPESELYLQKILKTDIIKKTFYLLFENDYEHRVTYQGDTKEGFCPLDWFQTNFYIKFKNTIRDFKENNCI